MNDNIKLSPEEMDIIIQANRSYNHHRSEGNATPMEYLDNTQIVKRTENGQNYLTYSEVERFLNWRDFAQNTCEVDILNYTEELDIKLVEYYNSQIDD